MRISDWSSDVCSSDLAPGEEQHGHRGKGRHGIRPTARVGGRLAGQVHSAILFAGTISCGGSNGGSEAIQPVTRVAVARVRSEERRVGKAFASTCRSRWSLCSLKKKLLIIIIST